MANPLLSVVVVGLIGRDALANCLDRLPLNEVECIVVLTKQMRCKSHLERRYPSVVFVETSDEPVPLRRIRGVMAAKGEIVGFLEDTSWPDEGWCAAIKVAFTEPNTAGVGGPVRIAPTLKSRCQALGWSEYGAFAAGQVVMPAANGAIRTDRVPGNNMAFRRSDLLKLLVNDEFVEGSICARLLAQGRQISYEASMLVTLSACDQHNLSLATRLHYGRIYASSRLKGSGWFARLLHLAKSMLLPIVLTSRVVSAMNAVGQANMRVPVLMWIGLMAVAWALGEALGSMTGVGRSMREWR
jgi:hypothetical protein